jgi:[ribosomal protein S18]-alanine N-acetyltransferase
MMSERLQARFDIGHFSIMRPEDLDAVMQIESEAYLVPWTRGNFVDSLASGCIAECLIGAHGLLLGYWVAMRGSDELHLLNLTVAPEAQHRGHGRRMLEHVAMRSRSERARQLWLEVRASNVRARALYRRFGFAEVGLRKAYYPPAPGRVPGTREDAITMSLQLGAVSC